MTTIDHPPQRRSLGAPTLADTTRRLQRTLERATRDRPHQAKHGTMVIGVRASDIDLLLGVVQALTGHFDLDEAPTQPDPSR